MANAVRANAAEAKMELPLDWDKDINQVVLRLFRQERAKAAIQHQKISRFLLTPRLFRAIAATAGATIKTVKPTDYFSIMGVTVMPTLEDTAEIPFYVYRATARLNRG